MACSQPSAHVTVRIALRQVGQGVRSLASCNVLSDRRWMKEGRMQGWTREWMGGLTGQQGLDLNTEQEKSAM